MQIRAIFLISYGRLCFKNKIWPPTTLSLRLDWTKKAKLVLHSVDSQSLKAPPVLRRFLTKQTSTSRLHLSPLWFQAKAEAAEAPGRVTGS